jgi:hypothetical protein
MPPVAPPGVPARYAKMPWLEPRVDSSNLLLGYQFTDEVSVSHSKVLGKICCKTCQIF